MDHGGKLCREHLAGACSRGQCRFVHVDPSGKGAKAAGASFCHDFHTGRCTRQVCSFVHGTPEQEKWFQETGDLPPDVAACLFAGGNGSDPAMAQAMMMQQPQQQMGDMNPMQMQQQQMMMQQQAMMGGGVPGQTPEQPGGAGAGGW